MFATPIRASHPQRSKPALNSWGMDSFKGRCTNSTTRLMRSNARSRSSRNLLANLHDRGRVPGLRRPEETLDLLRLNGIEYLADWVIDDLPQDITTPHGTMTTIPYSVETNDIVIHALQHLPSEQS